MEHMDPIIWAQADETPVQQLFPGIRLRRLWRGAGDASALLVEIDAGARWGELDIHAPGPEEVFVVSGTFNDGVRDYPAGTFIHNPAGSSHVPQSSAGCTLFVFYPQG
jgi:anti-sigma factor ChrR (cupin superfamily)